MIAPQQEHRKHATTSRDHNRAAVREIYVGENSTGSRLVRITGSRLVRIMHKKIEIKPVFTPYFVIIIFTPLCTFPTPAFGLTGDQQAEYKAPSVDRRLALKHLTASKQGRSNSSSTQPTAVGRKT